MLRESREHRRFASIADFLERVPLDCPHDLFRESERASQKAASFLDTSRLMIIRKENAATRMAGLVIPTVGDNRLRHEALQRFSDCGFRVNTPLTAHLENEERAYVLFSRSGGIGTEEQVAERAA